MVKNIKLYTLGKVLLFIAVLTLCFLICAPPFKVASADAVDAKIVTQDQTLHRGQTFEVDLNLTENTGILTMYITVKFDHNVFKLTNVQQIRQGLKDLNMLPSKGYDYIDDRTGGYNLIWDGDNNPDKNNGTIARLTFQSFITAPVGEYEIELEISENNTTKELDEYAKVEVTSPKITLTEGEYIVVWHDWNGAVNNTNINTQLHPYNQQTGGYEYNSDDALMKQDFPNNPTRATDKMYSYEFVGWEGAVWKGETPSNSSVIYYVAKYNLTPQKHTVTYYVDGINYKIDGKVIENTPDGIIEKNEILDAFDIDYNSVINEEFKPPYKEGYTFYGWYTDEKFTTKLSSSLMPADEIDLYGYYKLNIRQTDIPTIQLTYRETQTNEEMENIAYVDVYITRNYGLSSLMITLSEYDKTNLTFCGYEKGEIFQQMSFLTTNHTETEYPDNFNFSWNNSDVNSYEIGRLLVLKFKINVSASSGAYRIEMTADSQNTTYVKYNNITNNNDIWYSEVEFINTIIPIGETNSWVEPIPGTDEEIKVDSVKSVPYNVELVIRSIQSEKETIIDENSLSEVLTDNLTVHNLFEIYFQQNAKKLTQEEYTQYFGEENVTVKIKLNPLQINCKNMNIYYVDDNGKMILYKSKIENGYIVFETNHFSNWALVGDYMLTNTETGSIRLLRISLLFFGISTSALLAIAFVRNRKKQSLIVYKNGIKGGNED